jgi:hypothetical protein
MAQALFLRAGGATGVQSARQVASARLQQCAVRKSTSSRMAPKLAE